MDKTRASLRRVRIYAAVLVFCGVYAALPQTQREAAQERAQELSQGVRDWASKRLGGKP